MSAFAEACLLPLLFLTVGLLGSIRPGGAVTLVAPSLGSLVTAMILFAILVRSGTLAPERLMNAARSGLANVNGLSVLLAAYFASAAVIMLVVPDSGVPALIVWVVLASLLLEALAIAPDRERLLRGLFVIFGVTFTLKFVLLSALSTPAEGGLARVLQMVFEGLTLGTVTQRPPHPNEGYLAFATLVLYLVGVAWLPSATWRMVKSEAGAQERQVFRPTGQVPEVPAVPKAPELPKAPGGPAVPRVLDGEVDQ
jgi:hypothetical protein